MRKTKHKRGGRIGLVVILFAGLYVGYEFYKRHQDAEALREETLANAVPVVSVTNAQPGPASMSLTLPGNIEAWYQAPIYAQVSGYVKMWYKDYGAKVKKGDVQAEINAPSLDAQYAQALANVEAQRAKYNLAVVTANRWLALRKSQAVSEQSISEQVANEHARKALLDAAQQNVNHFVALERFKTIVTPYDGVVTARRINVGDYVNKEGGGSMTTAGNATELFSVADMHTMRLLISVPEAFAYILKPGLTADVIVPQFPDRHFTAKFLTVANGFDPNTRTAVTEFTINNADKALWPGSYGTVRLTAPNRTDMLALPNSTLVLQEQGTQVATVAPDGHIHFKSITVGEILHGRMLVAGISNSDRIVNNPSAALLEGDKVRVVPPTAGYNVVAQEASSKDLSSNNASLTDD
jgi:RND family efflux transporter MFP subunit